MERRPFEDVSEAELLPPLAAALRRRRDDADEPPEGAERGGKARRSHSEENRREPLRATIAQEEGSSPLPCVGRSEKSAKKPVRSRRFGVSCIAEGCDEHLCGLHA